MASLPLRPLWLHQTRLSGKAVRLNQNVTIVRNLEGLPFPAQASLPQRNIIVEQIREALGDFKTEWIECPLSIASSQERALLKSLANLEQPCDETVIWYHSKNFTQIIANDGDHVRFYGTFPGGTLKNAWGSLDALEEKIGEQLDYAFDPTNGYSASEPQLCGMGLRVQLLLHLPALCFDRQLPKLIEAASEMDLRLEPLRVSDHKALGHLFLLSNAVNLGIDEKSLLTHLETIAEKIISEELRIRKVMLTEHAAFSRDSIGRSLGLLGNCCELTFEEAMHLLSVVVMAVDNGILSVRKRALLLRLWRSLSLEHLREFCQKAISSSDEDRARAAIVKETMSQVFKKSSDAKRKISRAV